MPALTKNAPAGVRETQDCELIKNIFKAHSDSHGSYGSPRITRKLKSEGRHHGRKRIARLMRQEGLSGRVRRRYVPQTTQSNHNEPIAPNRLAQQAPPTGPHQVWISDITYVYTTEGWLYVAAILDLWSRLVVGWAVGESLAADLVVRALNQALTRRTPPAGLLYHSDRGVQYACRNFRQALSAANLLPSMSRKGNCYDNATMELFWSSYKTEWVYASPNTPPAPMPRQTRSATLKYFITEKDCTVPSVINLLSTSKTKITNYSFPPFTGVHKSGAIPVPQILPRSGNSFAS